MPYNNSDEKLIETISKNDDEDVAYNTLIKRYLEKYKIVVYSVSKRMNFYNCCVDDYLCNFFLSFKAALKGYDQSLGKFRTYFGKIFERSVMAEMLRKINSNDVLENYISLDDTVQDGLKRIDTIEDVFANDIVAKYNSDELKLMLCSKGKNKSRNDMLQSKAILLRSQGYSYKQISEQLKINISKVRRILKSKETTDFKKTYLRFK